MNRGPRTQTTTRKLPRRQLSPIPAAESRMRQDDIQRGQRTNVRPEDRLQRGGNQLRLRSCRKKKAPDGALKVCGPCIGGCGGLRAGIEKRGPGGLVSA